MFDISMCFCFFYFFFFKQKTAYEMRISDWSSDVCSSDLMARIALVARCGVDGVGGPRNLHQTDLRGAVDEAGGDGLAPRVDGPDPGRHEIGRASCRERVCQYV